MLIFIQEIGLQLFLWLLQLIDGLMEIFSAISGVANVNYHGQQVNIVEFIVGDSTIGAVFWCIFITAVGLTCIFTIVGLVKNMIANNRNVSTIVGKFFLALLGAMAMLAVVILGILIANSFLQLLARIFQVNNTTKLSTAIFNACVGEWLNGYSASNIDVTSLTVGQILGGYNAALFGIWPTSWKCNGMVNPNTFMYLPALIAGVALAIALIMAVLNLAKRVYEIVFTYFTMPVAMSTLFANKNNVVANAQMLLVFRFIEQEVINAREKNKGGANLHTLIIADEAHLYIDPKFPIALDFFYSMSKRIRKYNGSFIPATQNIADWNANEELRGKTSAIIKNSQYSFIFKLSAPDMKDVLDIYKAGDSFNDEEQRMIISAVTGQTFFVGSTELRNCILVKAGDYTQSLFEERKEEETN